MAIIKLSEEHLVERTTKVRKLLQPLAKNRRVSCSSVLSQIEQVRVIAAHDGTHASSSYRDWVFRTYAKDVDCQYFELWRPNQEDNSWWLDRAYLHLFYINRTERTREEIVCIHSDPADAMEFKRGPHLHVSKSEHPLPRCHFPLNLGELDSVVASCDSLTTAIQNAMRIVSQEVLTRYASLNT